MHRRYIVRRASLASAGLLVFLLPFVVVAQTPAGLSTEDRLRMDIARNELAKKIGKRHAAKPLLRPAETELLADVQIFDKGVEWALRYETTLKPEDVKLIQKALERGRQRIEALLQDKHAWTAKKGRVIRGYQSAIDGSVQPFGLIVPASYDARKPIRLDVVLHGSTRPVGLSELRFMHRFDEGDEGGGGPSGANYIELHPLGRVENCYRWAGETDVFEAIEAVCRNYNIDRDRIVLRGMSMGASGTWHLGLKHPDKFVALGPYCGYVDTHNFSMLPYKHFIKVGPLPPHQEKALHMLDSVDYAANAGVVPAVACMGEKDDAFSCHVLMNYAMHKEGLQLVNLISPGTGHTIDPITHREQMRMIGEYATRGLNRAPKELRFVTWTLKYSRCHWLQVLGLKEHYARAELAARVTDDGTVEVQEPKNVTRFAIRPPILQGPQARLKVAGREIVLPTREAADKPRTIVIGQRDGQWAYLGESESVVLDGKRPGVQGPIDDAFTAPFLCVRGTGQAWNPAVGAWAEASLKRFAYEWHRYFRGELPIIDDTALTEDDARRYNLILFGDPGNNRWIKKVLPKLPITWTKDVLQLGGAKHAAADHAVALIQPHPLPGAKGRYVVLNSGHTFREKELAAVNYLLFPRWGDWAVLKVGGKIPANPSEPLEEEVVRAGLFDESWMAR